MATSNGARAEAAGGRPPGRRWHGGVLAAFLVTALLFGAATLGGCEDESEEPEPVGPAAPPASVKGLLRLGVYGEAESSGAEPMRQTSLFVNGPGYRGMEDNDLRGFLDGRFMYGLNQPGQVHVRAGRRSMSSKHGEVELFRSIQRWEGVRLPPRARVHRAALELTVESGPNRPLSLFLYAVRKDWSPGRGGARGNNTDPPEVGDVWWAERAHAEEEWGLPGVGFASDEHPDADTEAMPLAEASWRLPQPLVVFESEALAAYAERRGRRGEPLLFLVKLDDYTEDEPHTLFAYYSGNVGTLRNPVRRPRLVLEWESRDELARVEREIHLEHGRTLELPALEGASERLLAASFIPAEGHERPILEVRGGKDDDWRDATHPVQVSGGPVRVRLVAARDPLPLGQPFRGEFRDTWLTSAPPEEQIVPWTFISPRGEHHVLEAHYVGDYRWEVEFQPTELGRWRYFYETSFTGPPGREHPPHRSGDGFFDVVAGDRETVHNGLRSLLARVREAALPSRKEAVAEFGVPFWRLERAALQLETPESFRSEEGGTTFDLLTEVRKALTGRKVPDRPRPRPLNRDF